MLYVVDNIFVASNCPKSLQPLAKEVEKAENYAFPDKDSLVCFIETAKNDYQDKEIRGVKFSVSHTVHRNHGRLCLRRQNADNNDFIRLDYFILRGHVNVSLDGRTLYPEQFLGFDHEVQGNQTGVFA